MALTAPSFIPQPWATSGQAAAIPNQKPEFGRASWSQGFPTETSIPLNAGGIPPNYLDFQGVLKTLSQFAFFQQSGGVFTWSSSLDYIVGCRILGSDGEMYVAQASSGPNVSGVGAKNPVNDDGTYWKAANASGAASGGGPIGGIIAFSGTFGGTSNRFPVPLGGTEPDTNWCLCDGIATNGLSVPDLRGRMIMGASDDHPAGSTGGSETHEHGLSGTVGETTTTLDQTAAHGHPIILTTTGQNGTVGVYGLSASTEAGRSNSRIISSGGSQPHTHSLSAFSTNAASNLPPYYALAYIMRCA